MQLLTECGNAIKWAESLCVEILKSKHLGYLFLLGVMAIFFMGIMLYIVDPNIQSPVDGVWSALSTITHVGFGDVIPVSFAGRMVAAFIILLGLIMLPLLTALISVMLMGKNIETLGSGMNQIQEEATSIQADESKILEELVRLNERMDKIEKALVTQNATR